MADKILVEHPAGNPPTLVNADYFATDLSRSDRPGGPWTKVTGESLRKRKKEELFDLAARLGVNVDPKATVKELADTIAGATGTTTAQEG
jgi:hypothetical protein